jgi:hypothetical protein
MPQKDDFLTRLQEQVNLTLEQVRVLEAEGELDTALETLHDMQQRVTGLESTLLHHLSETDLLMLLTPAGQPNLEKTLQCAELLGAEYALREAHGGAEPALAHKALALYLSALTAESGLLNHYSAQLETLARLAHYALPTDMQQQLVLSYAQAGQFANAENWLYRWQALEPEAARAQAEIFYRELLDLDDAALEAGGLPRDEVEEGLAQITETRV